MFDPKNWSAVVDLEDADLALLPRREDERHEYKSSTTKDVELTDKVARAASGFWNSGGGLLVVGVNGGGEPDGGIAPTIGRQSRQDWIDQAISRVSPCDHYAIKCIEGRGGGSISSGKVVVAVGFGASENGPHMAPDNRYYLRAGAHTLPASHFLVEAIRARRGLMVPVLRHVVRRKPEGGGVLQLGIVSLNDAPALDVQVDLNPVPEWLEKWGPKLPLVVPVISRETLFYFDFHILTMGQKPHPTFQVDLTFSDLLGRQHSAVLGVDVDKQMGPNLGSENELRDVQRAIDKVADAINRKR